MLHIVKYFSVSMEIANYHVSAKNILFYQLD